MAVPIEDIRLLTEKILAYSRAPNASARIRGWSMSRLPTEAPNRNNPTHRVTTLNPPASMESEPACNSIIHTANNLIEPRSTTQPPIKRPTMLATGRMATTSAV